MSTPYFMLLEDRDEDVELTLRAFKKARIRNDVVVMRDGVEALEFLEGLAGNVDRPKLVLMLLDVNTPRMNGITLLERVRKLNHLRHVPIVMLTSSNEEGDLLASYDGGANSYLRKPVGQAEFAALIERLGMYWAIINEIP